MLLAVFASASALHRTAATRKFPQCCVYSPRWSGAAGARPHCMRPRFQLVTLTMGAEPTTDRTVVPDETLQMCCGAARVRRVYRELSRSPRALFPMQAEWRLSRIAGSVEKRTDPGLSGVARCLLQSHSQAEGEAHCRIRSQGAQRLERHQWRRFARSTWIHQRGAVSDARLTRRSATAAVSWRTARRPCTDVIRTRNTTGPCVGACDDTRPAAGNHHSGR